MLVIIFLPHFIMKKKQWHNCFCCFFFDSFDASIFWYLFPLLFNKRRNKSGDATFINLEIIAYVFFAYEQRKAPFGASVVICQPLLVTPFS